MKTQSLYCILFIGFLLTTSWTHAQKGSLKAKPDQVVLTTGWYAIHEKGAIERALSHKEEVFHLDAEPIILWSDVETIRLINREKFNYGAILIALKKEKIKALKEHDSLPQESQWGLVVNNELVLVQSIDRQNFSGNFQIATQDHLEWLEALYEQLKSPK